MKNDDKLRFLGTKGVDSSPDSTPRRLRYVRQVYWEKCGDCDGAIQWYRWVACTTGTHGPGRHLSKRRFLICAFCAAKNYRPKKKVESDLDKWMRLHGKGVQIPRRLNLVTSSHTGKLN